MLAHFNDSATSEHLAEMFGDFGFKQVYSLAGGYAGWKKHHNLTR